MFVTGSAASLNQSSQNFTPFRTCTITATPSGTTAVRDAHVQQATATTNFGTATAMNVASATAANRRLLEIGNWPTARTLQERAHGDPKPIQRVPPFPSLDEG